MVLANITHFLIKAYSQGPLSLRRAVLYSSIAEHLITLGGVRTIRPDRPVFLVRLTVVLCLCIQWKCASFPNQAQASSELDPNLRWVAEHLVWCTRSQSSSQRDCVRLRCSFGIMYSTRCALVYLAWPPSVFIFFCQ